MIVKRIDNNRLVTMHELGSMYAAPKTKEREQKFLRSAENLSDAIETAEKYSQEWFKKGKGCVIAEVSATSHRRIVKKRNGKPFVSRKPFKEKTTVWLVYLAPDGSKHKVLQEGKIRTIGEKIV